MLVQKFIQTAQVNIQRLAIVHGNTQITYGELNDRSNQIAQSLSEIKQSDPIGLVLHPEIGMPIGILGILKAGGCFVPIDPNLPQNRIDAIIKQAKIKTILTNSKLPPLASSVTVKYVDLPSPILDTRQTAIPVEQKSCAYILFTSGSTGLPKGICISHESLSNYLQWFTHTFPAEDTLFPLTSSISFAAAISQIFPPLLQGKTLHIPIQDLKTDPKAFFLWFKEHPDKSFYCVPSVWSNILKFAVEYPTPSTRYHPKKVFLSGESPSKELVTQTLRLWPKISLQNLYGPTEAVSNLTYAPLHSNKRPTLGNPLGKTELYILDENLDPTEDGQAGEIYASSPTLATNYVGSPSLTAQAFMPNPFTKDPGLRMYKTGDRATRTGDKITFLGRADSQVKIRGYRVELEEIENLVKNHPSVSQAVALYYNEKLTVFYSSPNIEPHKQKKLFSSLSKALPHYMIPNRLIEVKKFPTLPSGKIDRTLLKSAAYSSDTSENNYIPPSTTNEKILVKIWEEVFATSPIGINHSFYFLGGHSLLAAQIMQKLSIHYNLKLTIPDILKQPTIQALGLLAKTSNESWTPNFLAKLNNPIVPLSFAQEQLWFIHQLSPNTSPYTITICNQLSGPIDIDRFREALNKCLEANIILRCVPTYINGIRQLKELPPTTPFPLEIIKCRKEEKDSLLKEKLDQFFEFNDKPLCRAHLITFSENECLLSLTFHHIIFDNDSRFLFLKQLSNYYSNIKASAQKMDGYRNFSAWQRSSFERSIHDEKTNYWKKKLQNLAALPLPYDFEIPTPFKESGSTITRRLPLETKTAIEQLSIETESTVFTILLAVFKGTLSFFTNHSDITVGSAVSSRNHELLKEEIGFFVDTVVYRTQCDKRKEFLTFLEEVKKTVLEAYYHLEVPFSKIVEEAAPLRTPQKNPLFQVYFVLEYEETDALELDNIIVKPFHIPSNSSKFSLSLNILIFKKHIDLNFEYSPELFNNKSIERLGNYFLSFLNEILKTPGKKICELPLLSKQETNFLSPPTNYSPDHLNSFIEEFESIVEAHHDTIALTYQSENITYRTLNEKANQMARFLQSLGGQPEVRVGVCSPRSIDLIIGMLAIFKCQSVYVPIDPANPDKRIQRMVKSAHLSFILTTKELSYKYSSAIDPANVFVFDEIDYSNFSQSNLRLDWHPSNLAYIMFTSGSTGNPKPTGVENRSIMNWLHWNQKKYLFQKSDRIFQKTSTSFDISLAELLPPLRIGATLVLASQTIHKELDILAHEIWKHHITVLNLVPSMLKSLSKYKEVISKSSLKFIFFCGEALHSSAFKNSGLQDFANIQIHNQYGPVEATVETSSYSCAQENQFGIIPIGRPITNTQIYILDKTLSLVPPNTPGELFIGGEGLARGYIGMPGLTAEKFISNPFGPPGSRMYATGDVAKIDDGGNLIFIGRNDHQIKIRGHRVEPAEIENVLSKLDEIIEVIALPRSQRDNTLIDVYYSSLSPISQSYLRDQIKEHLPEHMTPSNFIHFPRLPRGVSGKIDPSSVSRMSSMSRAPSLASEDNLSKLEHIVLSIWKKVLEKEEISISDNFFDIGGHSLLLVEVIDKLQPLTSIPLKVIDLFQYPTIKKLCEHIANKKNLLNLKDEGVSDRLIKIQQARKQRLALKTLKEPSKRKS